MFWRGDDALFVIAPLLKVAQHLKRQGWSVLCDGARDGVCSGYCSKLNSYLFHIGSVLNAASTITRPSTYSSAQPFQLSYLLSTFGCDLSKRRLSFPLFIPSPLFPCPPFTPLQNLLPALPSPSLFRLSLPLLPPPPPAPSSPPLLPDPMVVAATTTTRRKCTRRYRTNSTRILIAYQLRALSGNRSPTRKILSRKMIFDIQRA